MQRKNEGGVKAMREELWSTRNTILGLSRKRLDWWSYPNSPTSMEHYRWKRTMVEEAIELAEIVSAPATVDRAYYPLCGEGTHPFSGVQGFAVPVGLQQHLMGLGKARQCVVTQAAFAFASEAIQRQTEV